MSGGRVSKLTVRQLKIGSACLAMLIAVATWYAWPRPRPNLLIVTLDTARADRLGCYGYREGATPVMDALAASGVLFERAYVTAPLTLPSHATMFTGLYPAEHGLRTNGKGRLNSEIPVLAELLAARGYQTAAFIASFVLDRKYGLDRGFATFNDDLTLEDASHGESHLYRDGSLVVDSVLKWFSGRTDQPFFCWVHLYDPHFPYQAHSAEFDGRFDQSPYDGEIAYVDGQIKRLLEFLKNRQLDGNTLIVVVGDHGEGLGEHEERQHGLMLYNTTLHVPFFLSFPGTIAAGKRVSAPVSVADLTPTILDCLGAPQPAGVGGRSLKPAWQGQESPASLCYAATDGPFLEGDWSPLRSLIVGDWKYIRTARPELYDLRSEPQERHNLAETRQDLLQEFEQQMSQHEAAMKARGADEARLSARDRQNLASLGYLADQRTVSPSLADGSPRADIKDMMRYVNLCEDGEHLLEAGEPEAGMEKLRQVIKASPEYALPYLYLGTALTRQGNLDAAAETYRSILKLKPEAYDARFGLGCVLHRQDRIAEAIEEFQAALRIDSESAEPHHNLGVIFQDTGRPQEALTHYKEAVRIDPLHDKARVNLANVLLSQGRHAEAKEQYREAIRANPKSIEAHVNLGTLLAQEGRLREADAELRTAVRLDPDHPAVRALLNSSEPVPSNQNQ